MSNITGQSLGRYHILEQLGEGGMATVYKAFDTALQRNVAIKIIRAESLTGEKLSKTLKRFDREARTLARLAHPNIVPIIDYGQFQGEPFLVMPYLPGGTLKVKLGTPIPWQEALQLLLPVARALDYAHQQGIIHRDVKPANILLDQKGTPILSDFGIAKMIEAEETLDLTGSSLGVGTPAYIAPEQFQGRQLDGRADIYALGVVLYELVTGRRPYTGNTPGEILWKQASEALPAPRQYNPHIPARVEKVILKALAKNPQARYADAAQFADAMQNLLPSALPEGAIKRRDRRTPFPRKVLVTGLAGLVMLLVLIGFLQYASSNKLLAAFKSTTLEDQSPAGILSTQTGQTQPPPAFPSPGEALASVSINTTPAFTAAPGPLGSKISTSTPFAPPATPTSVSGIELSAVPLAAAINQKGAEMLLVPGGTFMMGSDLPFGDARPPHQVTLDTFYMDKYEVTNGLYKLCVDAGVCQPPTLTRSTTRSGYYGNPAYDNYPVIYVTWNMALDYCHWRGASLPTEAEWEYAARSTDGRIYPWGNYIDDSRANYNRNTGDTYAVGRFDRGQSPFGMLDMGGNVREFVFDWHGGYSSASVVNPVGPESGDVRVARGGGWAEVDEMVHSTTRSSGSDDPGTGFRCAMSSTDLGLLSRVTPVPTNDPLVTPTAGTPFAYKCNVGTKTESYSCSCTLQMCGCYVHQLSGGWDWKDIDLRTIKDLQRKYSGRCN